MSSFDCKDIVAIMFKAYEILTRKQVKNVKEVSNWLQLGNKNIKILQTLLRNSENNTSIKSKYISTIALLKGVQAKLKLLTVKKGAGLARERRSDRVEWQDLESAFKDRVKSSVIINLKHLDILSFMKDAQVLFTARIKNILKQHSAVKVYAVLTAEFAMIKEDKIITEIKHFNTKADSILQATELKHWFNEKVQQTILKDLEEFQERDSGWTLKSILNLCININKYNPIRGNSYIPLPPEIKKKQACVNVQNFDDECFKWAVLSALHPTRKSDRVSEYMKYKDDLDFTDIQFPVTLKQITKFEKQNNISINVYVLRKSNAKYDVAPSRITSHKRDRHVNLLLLQRFYEDEGAYNKDDVNIDNVQMYHYVWIKDMSRLLRNQISKRKNKHYICDRCLHFFYNPNALTQHEIDCKKLNKCRVDLPTEKNKFLGFINYKNKEKTPYIIYADFESLLKPINMGNNIQEHEAYSIGYYLNCSYDCKQSYYRSYRGINPAKWFVNELQQIAKEVEKIFQCSKPMDELTATQKEEFINATKCHICEQLLLSKDKVKDHCHLTGRYRGPAHNNCNLNYKDTHAIPVVFHNLSGYDAHFIIREIATNLEGRIELLPLTKERYISFTKYIDKTNINFRFIDSFRFLASSLDKLASYLDDLIIVKQVFSKYIPLSEEKFQLLRRKGVFPYEFVDSWDKLEITELPSKHKFYSTLNNSDISDEDYEHAKKVWKTFNIKTIAEYSDLYLQTDVLLLADVFENFRDNCMNSYHLDPAHYYTTPGFTWDAMLKYTNIKLELLTDIDMIMFIEQGIRGGISQCCNRYAQANNRYMGDSYDKTKELKYLMYFDANNLYGWAMQQYLPYEGFEWVEDLDNIDFNISDESPIGYILEVDLQYPEYLHDIHKDLPFCAEHKKPPNSKQEKLLTTLEDKSHYILHYRNLKQTLKNGLILKKIHRVLKFNQKPWLKDYIDLNSKLRQKAKNEFEKNLFKLMNNAVFGKTMENVRKRVDIKLVTKWEGRYGAEALIAKPNFHSRTIFGENLIAVQLEKLKVYLNKPIYVGLCVLDISKILMYNFHYDYMIHKFQNNCKLLYMDTDSLIYEIIGTDIYEVMKRDIEHFDTSDYPTDNIFNIPQANKKIVGLMKDECNGQIMTEFVGLRSKMYSIRIDGKDTIKKVKGVKSSVVKNTITFDDYIESLRNATVQFREQHIITSQLHNVYTKKQTKIALSPFDDKRYLTDNDTDTLPWGHYKTIQIDEM